MANNDYVGIKLSTTTACIHPGTIPSQTSQRGSTSLNKGFVKTSFEIVFFLEDGGYTFINNKPYPITAGSIRFLRPGDRVYSERLSQRLIVFFDADDRDYAQKVFESIPPLVISSNVEKDTALLTRVVRAHAMQDHFECSVCLLRFLGQLKEISQTQKDTTNGSIIFQIRNYIDENYSKNITRSELGKKFHMNPDYLRRKFKKDFGQSPAEYQLEVRLNQAVAMLRSSHLSVEQIAESCGFSNSSHFIRAFKHKMDITPSQFRRDYFLTTNFF